MIDVNVSLSRWPFRRLPLDETPRLMERLREKGITQAWAGSFDALLHEDMAGVNARLAEDCATAGKGILLPFGSVNPNLPDWEEDVRRCAEEHGMRGIRLHPDYHGYQLDDPAVPRLLDLAGEQGLIVQITLLMEDERTRHPLVGLEKVDAAPLVKLATERPELSLILLNSQRVVRGALQGELAAAGVCFDIAMQEGVGGISKLMQQVPFEQILFGSHAPFFYFESAELKLRESELGATVRAAIASGNAERESGVGS
ncbi:Amidohydrolase [Maioricimonas rarisocia]|uniref:Amidohydrolase n=1 Tax=Maioricimonas rarisocia TaxID=2528026 RepID=A0A517Z4N7_9PLAN|nr:amidohydrolase family protein [Maioricimonas rarisocia]QDU37419.1 Amidohydrolase [Maioricimonas rarisocia]